MAFLSTSARGRSRWEASRRWLTLLVLAVAARLALLPTIAATPSPIPDEYQIKAVFLFNFAQFVEWPAQAFPAKDAPLVIGILGQDPFGSYLDELVRGERIGDRPLVVRRPKTPGEIAACHILFISRSEAGALDRIVAGLRGRSILTIGDADTFTRAGGMVRFVTDGGKIRLRINVDAAKSCGLTISSKIIRPSRIVTAE